MTAGSTAILHSGNQAHKAQLLSKIGGSAVLHQAVDLFYAKLLNDPRLAAFFAHANISVLKWHQFNILSFAFTTVPENFDIEDLLLTRHKSLFDDGMCETQFDIVMEHFVSTLTELHVATPVINDAQRGIAPLRDIFQRGADEARRRKAGMLQRQSRHLHVLIAATAAGVAAVTVGLYLRRRAKH